MVPMVVACVGGEGGMRWHLWVVGGDGSDGLHPATCIENRRNGRIEGYEGCP